MCDSTKDTAILNERIKAQSEKTEQSLKAIGRSIDLLREELDQLSEDIERLKAFYWKASGTLAALFVGAQLLAKFL